MEVVALKNGMESAAPMPAMRPISVPVPDGSVHWLSSLPFASGCCECCAPPLDF